MGQINLIILLFIVLNYHFWLKGDDILTGIFLGLSLISKPLFWLLVLFFFGMQKWRIILSAIFVLLAGWLTSVIFLGRTMSLEFFKFGMPGNLLDMNNNYYYNQSFLAGLTRIAGVGKTALFGYLVFLGVILFLSVYKISFIRRKLVYCLFLTVNLIVNTVVWQHHLVFMTLPLIIIFQELSDRKKGEARYFVLFLIYFLLSFNFKNPLQEGGFSGENLLLAHGLLGVLGIWLILLGLLRRW